jgi:translation initiation factor IF-2
VKVFDLAKKLGTSPKELIRFLADVDIKVKSPNTKLSDDIVEQVSGLFKGETPEDKAAEIRSITFDDESITVQKLAELMQVSLGDVMRSTLKRGLLVNLNSELDLQMAQDIATEFNIIFESPILSADSPAARTLRDDIHDMVSSDQTDDDSVERPPVITIMGHVDHGKTLLLDTIRKSNVIDTESGGITQHIGAYQVDVSGKKLTFLDTPGHEAFTALRARGAQVTDIVILVVAADEGLKPQTIEAIHHAKAANVPIIVAINKIDKPDANPDRVMQQLSEHELVAEEWGGSTIMVPISAKKNTGIDTLLEMLLLLASTLELKASARRMAKGVVIESRLSRKKGPIATILVKTGTLRIGDVFVIGTSNGKIRALINDHGDSVTEVLPGTPVEILGLSEVPSPGNLLEVCATEKEAKELAEASLLQQQETARSMRPVSLSSISQQIQEGESLSINLIVKADVHGSLEAIVASVTQLSSDKISVRVIHAATGEINENDIMLAVASSAIVVAFHVATRNEAAKLASEEGVEVKSYEIIYEIVDDIKKSILGLFKPEYEEVETARIEVRQLFKFSKVGVIAGSYVLSGKAVRNSLAYVLRDGKEIYRGKLESLKRFKEDVKDVATGFECGIVLEDFSDLQEGDVIVCFAMQEKKPQK